MIMTLCKMDNLFKKELRDSLNLTREIIPFSEKTKNSEFDLTDNRKQTMILQKGNGDATYENSLGRELYILDFENLRSQFNPCAILDNQKIIKRCDYFIAEKEEKSICIFNEITSSQEKYLTKKEDTTKQQLLHSLECVKKCENLWSEITNFKHKVCLFSFKIPNGNEVQNAFNRPLKEGQIPNEEIEELGFEYRRIDYTPFKIS